MDLGYESLPQRTLNPKRRRRERTEEGNLVDVSGASESGVIGGSGGGGDGDTAAPHPASAQPGASPSGARGRGVPQAGRPQLQHIDMPEFRTGAAPGQSFEYLDHTADVQLHAWGATLGQAFANAALAMYNYMTPLEGVQPALTRTFEASGHDLHSLLFAFLDELLFTFATELFVCRQLAVNTLDRGVWTIRATGRGEAFVRGRHEAGTEVKAITYSAMQVREAPGDCEVFVIVDI